MVTSLCVKDLQNVFKFLNTLNGSSLLSFWEKDFHISMFWILAGRPSYSSGLLGTFLSSILNSGRQLNS